MSDLIEPDEKRFKELVLYIARQSETDERFGATKLNKLLFYSDFLAYVRLGKPITGVEYFRLPNGPAPRRLVPLRRELEAEEACRLVSRAVGPRTQFKLLALRDPDLSLFTAEQVSIVDEVIDQFWDATAHEISLVSHGFLGWELARDEETIPYQTAWVDPRKLTSEEIRQGQELAAGSG